MCFTVASESHKFQLYKQTPLCFTIASESHKFQFYKLSPLCVSALRLNRTSFSFINKTRYVSESHKFQLYKQSALGVSSFCLYPSFVCLIELNGCKSQTAMQKPRSELGSKS